MLSIYSVPEALVDTGATVESKTLSTLVGAAVDKQVSKGTNVIAVVELCAVRKQAG